MQKISPWAEDWKLKKGWSLGPQEVLTPTSQFCCVTRLTHNEESDPFSSYSTKLSLNHILRHLHRNTQRNIWPNIWLPRLSPVDIWDNTTVSCVFFLNFLKLFSPFLIFSLIYFFLLLNLFQKWLYCCSIQNECNLWNVNVSHPYITPA